MSNCSLLKSALCQLDIKINESQVKKFQKYMDLIIEWNNKINLTTVINPKEIIIRHFVDAATLFCGNLNYRSSKIIDIGTGPGLPGVVMKIIDDTIDLTLLESVRKKTDFLEIVKSELELENVDIVNDRAENIGNDTIYREMYDYAVSRAVAQLRVLSEYAIPLLKIGGSFIALKGPKLSEELKNSNNAINILGGTVRDIFDIKVPYDDRNNSIVVIDKTKKSPNKYPRNPGKPKKTPL